MGRKRREDKLLLGIIQFSAFLFGIWYVIPSARPVISKYGIATVSAMILLFIGQLALRKRLGVGRAAKVIASRNKLPGALDQLNPSNSPGLEASTASSPDSLLSQLRAADWFQFEKASALLYEALGHKVTRKGGANPDGGIDLIIEKDGIATAIQCKQWRTREVGVRTAREFLGAMTDSQISHGQIVTLCGFTDEARQLAEKHGIGMVEEQEIARLFGAVDADHRGRIQAVLNDTAKYCPKCEAEMVLRTAGKGAGAGTQFWGCSTYPRCRFTMPVSP